jgi:hypothetical protein
MRSVTAVVEACDEYQDGLGAWVAGFLKETRENTARGQKGEADHWQQRMMTFSEWPCSEWAALRKLHEDHDGPWGDGSDLYYERSLAWSKWSRRKGFPVGFSYASLLASLQE